MTTSSAGTSDHGLSKPSNWKRFGKTGAYIVTAGVAMSMLLSSFLGQNHLTAGLVFRRLNPFANPVRKFSADLEDDKVLNVHVVPHTHDDVGWLKTVEQYYYGLNNTIQHASVHSILDTVVEALTQNSARTFVYVETKFFSMWWKEQTEEKKEALRYLVANRQFQFANGGWCMHDEATTHFMGMLDQTTLGHQFLLRELGYVPRVGWQLDPFGHSATQASLFTARAGFDALYFGRIDYQDLELRLANRDCEGLWHTNLNDTVFWGLTGSYSGGYSEYPGFCYDVRCWDEYLLDKNQTSFDKSIEEFVADIKLQSDRTRGNHIMITMGSDFRYEKALKSFANTDALIASVMQYQYWGKINVPKIFGPRYNRVNIFYSSPEYYTDMKNAETIKWQQQESEISTTAKDVTNEILSWSIKSDDFFPYADCEHCYWTGYFTSRATLKRLERVSSSFLLAARQIESLPNASGSNDDQCLDDSDGSKIDDCPCGKRPLYELEDALGVAQHHDAVSGTAKQHVAFDYARRLHSGISRAERFLVKTLRQVVLQPSDVGKYFQDLSYCQLLNETICDVSQNATRVVGTNDVYVLVYNPLASPRSSVIVLPVSIYADFHIQRLDEIADDSSSSEMLKVTSIPRLETSFQRSADFALIFQTGLLPPVGAAIFKISSVSAHVKLPQFTEVLSDSRRELIDPAPTESEQSALEVSNGLFTVKFDRSTGMMIQLSSDNGDADLSQKWGYYESFDSSKDGNPEGHGSEVTQDSGAYIFRPSEAKATFHVVEPLAGMAKFHNLTNGFEVHPQFSVPWVKQIVRVYHGVPYIEVDYIIGPIPIDDGRGKEVVVRYLTPIKSKGEFYTDSNGREFLKRARNIRPTWNLTVNQPVAGNYYPVNVAIYVEDKDAALAVLVDRSQGGASIIDGSVELMVQRRTVQDDARGVGEAINETVGGVTPYPPYGAAVRVGEGVVISGRHRIMLGKGPIGARMTRTEMDSAFADPLVFVASAPTKTNVPLKVANFSVIQAALPKNVMLITLSRLHDAPATTFLIRFGHQFDWNEDEEMSHPVKIDLAAVLAGYKVLSVSEKTLTGNQNYSTWLSTRLKWTKGSLTRGSESGLVGGTVFEINPMEIRTFEVRVA